MIIDPSIESEIMNELLRAQSLGFGLFDSPMEGYAVILEEADELKAEVWKNQKTRDLARMRKEAIEVAAMALKLIVSAYVNTAAQAGEESSNTCKQAFKGLFDGFQSSNEYVALHPRSAHEAMAYIIKNMDSLRGNVFHPVGMPADDKSHVRRSCLTLMAAAICLIRGIDAGAIK